MQTCPYDSPHLTDFFNSLSKSGVTSDCRLLLYVTLYCSDLFLSREPVSNMQKRVSLLSVILKWEKEVDPTQAGSAGTRAAGIPLEAGLPKNKSWSSHVMPQEC